MQSPGLQHRIAEIGHAIFSQVRDVQDFVNPAARVDEWLTGHIVASERVKTQLFRFVDTLPALDSGSAVASHLRQHLRAGGVGGWIDWIPSGLLAPAARLNVRRMARQFIAAEDLDQAVAAIGRLRKRRLGFTIDLLGEAAVAESEAERYQEQYRALAAELPSRLAGLVEDPLIDRDHHGPIPRTNISVKLSSLYSQFDPLDAEGTKRVVIDRLRPILRAARKAGAAINLDMEQWAFKDITLRIFKDVFADAEFADWADVGLAMQAYLHDAQRDLHGLADWAARRGTPIWVRLVKGAYWDYETVIAARNNWPTPVFTHKADTDANFEAATEFLMRHHALLRPAVASHNIRSIAAALALAEQYGVPRRAFEFQMLYGMGEPIKAALVAMQQRVRVYTPFGKLLPGMAYLVRRLLENTSNESFLQAGFVKHLPEEQLLMNPLLAPRDGAAPPRPEFLNTPPTDFSRPAAQEAMRQALAALTPQVRPLVIGGQRVTGHQWLDSVNPSHKSRIVGRAACATAEHARQAIERAARAFGGWRDTPAAERAELLERVGEELLRRRFAIAALEVVECGKPWREADADVGEAIDFCRYYARQMRRLSEPRGISAAGEENQWLYEPRGVAVVIAPWNFPLAILTGMATAAVVCGNPVILKPAEQSPLVAAELMEAFERAGAPAGVVNYLPGIGEEIGPTLTEHPDVAVVAFTGSRAVGLGINAAAAKPAPQQSVVKRIILEMGGKNAIIVDDDADLDEAVTGIVASAFGYAGQKCSACSRVIALAGVHEALTARLVEATRSLKIAPAEDPACRVGPVIDGEAMQRIMNAISRGATDARLIYAGDPGPLAKEGYYVGPHLFADVPPSSALATEEIFGPVLSILRAADLDEALALANGVKYALTGGLYSRSPAHIQRCRREFRVGNLYINRGTTGALVGRQPFGGFKLSGGGTQAGGPDYLLNFLLPRCVTENTLRRGFAPVDEGNRSYPREPSSR